MLHNIEFRPYKNSYCQEIINLFVDTVMNIKDYSPIQITAWIGHPTVSDWHPRFVNSDTIVAIYGVSITAVSLFQSRGFDIIEERYPVRNSVQLRNYKMLKVLT